MKHFGAVVVAVALIATAIFVRNRIDHDDKAASKPAPIVVDATVVCDDELALVCKTLASRFTGLKVRTESAATTEKLLLDATSPGDLDFDAWLAPAPFPEMVADQRARAVKEAVLNEPSPVVAWSPMVMVAWNDRLDALENSCPEHEVTWKCIGNFAGTPWSTNGGNEAWGAVKIGYQTPDTSATGLMVTAQAASSWFGTGAFAANDFKDQGFHDWFARLEHGVVNRPIPPRTPLEDMLSKGRSSVDIVGETEAAATTRIRGTRSQGDLEIIYPEPSVAFEVAVATVVGSDAGEGLPELFMSEEVSTVFTDAGWKTGPAPSESSTGLPPAGVLEALRKLWMDIT